MMLACLDSREACCDPGVKEESEKMRGERTTKAMKIKIIDSHIKGYHIFHIRPHFEIPMILLLPHPIPGLDFRRNPVI